MIREIERSERAEQAAEGVADLGGVSYDEFSRRWATTESPAARARRIRTKHVSAEQLASVRRLLAA